MQYSAFGLALTTAAVLGCLLPAKAQSIPDYYGGIGVRAFLNDPTSFVVDSKLKIADIGDFSLSTRPAVMVGGDIVEGRLPVTVETAVTSSIYPYAGFGLAYNTGGAEKIEPMVTGGLDIRVAERLYLDSNLNVIFKSGAGTDTELLFTLNYKI